MIFILKNLFRVISFFPSDSLEEKVLKYFVYFWEFHAAENNDWWKGAELWETQFRMLNYLLTQYRLVLWSLGLLDLPLLLGMCVVTAWVSIFSICSVAKQNCGFSRWIFTYDPSQNLLLVQKVAFSPVVQEGPQAFRALMLSTSCQDICI